VFRWGGRYYPKFDYLPQVFRAKTLLGNLALDVGDSYFTSMSTLRDGVLDSVLSPDLRSTLNGYCPRDSFRRRFQKFSHLPPLQQMQAVDMETYLPGDILVKADRATMAHSLESRSPWLDYRLAELSFRLPEGLKIHRGIGKYAFKKAVEPLVPHENIYRSKMGFSVPLAQWFQSSLRAVFRSLVLDNTDMDRYVFRPGVRRLWNEHQSGLANHDRKLWNLLMLACWHSRTRDRQSTASIRQLVS
jgi:asparagine synthase (glutamine-hydrolysing)